MEIFRNNLVRRGFTFVEVMVSIAIIGLLAAIAVPSYAQLRINVGLKSESDRLVSVLRTAQTNAIVSQSNVDHGVHFETDHYVLFEDTWASIGKTYTFEAGVEVLPGSDMEVIFSRLYGRVTSPVSIFIGYPSGPQKTITVDALGTISIL